MNLGERYQKWRDEATALAGDPSDIRQRAAILSDIFRDSKGNNGFAQIAAHGALWAFNFFEATGTLGKLISYRYFYNGREMKYRHSLLQGFSDGFKTANRSVFIDTYSNYYFTKELGREKGAEKILEPDLLEVLNKVHRATAAGKTLEVSERRKIFRTALQWEQEVTVAPKVKEEVAKFDCPILKRLVLKPFVRFRYFPRVKFFWFKNFSSTEERITRAHECFEIAERAGWEQVFSTLGDYQVLDPDFFRNPVEFTQKLKTRLLKQKG
ncbi:MAG: hypothetical protein R2747_19435 [Pyrinomonadaceae bacterium]